MNVAIESPNYFPDNYNYLKLEIEDEVGEVVLEHMDEVFAHIEK